MSTILDGNGLELRQFYGVNDQVSDNNVGSLGLQITVIGNASTLAQQTGTSSYGTTVLRTTTAATANGDGTALHTFPDGLVIQPGTYLRGVFEYPVELASGNFRFGLDNSVTATRPTVGVTIESDAGVLSCHTDSSNGDNAADVAPAGQGVNGTGQMRSAHPDLTSGTTMAVGSIYEFEIVCSGEANANGGPDEVDFYVNGTHVAKVPSSIGNDETVELKVAHWQDSGGADAVALDHTGIVARIPGL